MTEDTSRARVVRAWFARAVARCVAPLVGRPVTLPDALAKQWPELQGARYRRGGLPPRVGGWCLGASTVAAITLWRTVWLGERTPWDDTLLLHELRHVYQFATTPAFPARYIWESLRRGYSANRFEVDACSFAARRLQESAANPSTEDA